MRSSSGASPTAATAALLLLLTAALGCSSSPSTSAATAACDSGTCVEGDASPQVLPVDPPPPVDAAPAAACDPLEIPTFTPVSVPSLIKPVCTDAQLHEIAAACAKGDCSQALNAPENQLCASGHCLYTPYATLPVTPGVNPVPAPVGPWGPIIALRSVNDHGLSYTRMNKGACIALADPSRSDCANKATALFECEVTACAAACSAGADGTFNEGALIDCMIRSEGNPAACQTFANLDDRCGTDITTANSPAAFCYNDLANFDTAKVAAAYEKLFKLQCGLPADGSICLPTDITGFQPAPLVAPLVQKACSPAQLLAFATDCFGPTATGTACSQWTGNAANATCFDCFRSAYSSTPITPGVTPPPAPTGPWAPLVFVEDAAMNYTMLTNYGGCVLAADPTQTACAGALEAFQECEVASCAATCPLPNPSSAQYSSMYARFQNCMETADTGPCQAYYDATLTQCSALIRPNWADAGTSVSPAAVCVSTALGSTDPAVANPAWAKFFGAQCHQ